ncbi:MAG: MlaD family protein [Rhabdochlamydiaceae bacterium]|jgi:phospholipid/cholesterol/gamma-HCH transport system substrate-binding protein
MSNSIKNFIIGLFLLSSLGVFIGLVMFLKPSIGDEKQTILIRFSNVNKIAVGTRVLFAGKAVGEVTAINEIYHARDTQPTDQLGRLYFYQLTLKIDSNVHVYSTDEISMQTSGLLGEKSIAIIPKAPPKGVQPELLTDKSPFYADSIDPLENTFNRLSDIGDKLDVTVGMVKTWFEQNEANLARSISSFDAAMAQIDTLTASVNQESLIPQMKEATIAMTSSMEKVNSALGTLMQDKVFENFGTIASNLSIASTSIDKMCQNLNSGQSTLGKMINADDMYLRLTAIMSKADTMMNDINHYGVLFHLNKGWQRTHTKRISQLDALDSPVAFKDYFQSEIDQINTSMSRISMLVEKAREGEENKVLETPSFRDNFAELLRQVDEMSGNLRLYNEQYSHSLKP